MKQLILSLVAILAALGIPLHAETVTVTKTVTFNTTEANGTSVLDKEIVEGNVKVIFAKQADYKGTSYNDSVKFEVVHPRLSR